MPAANRLTPAQEARRKAFMTAVKGPSPWWVATALSRLTPGINWGGCSKGHMAECWACKTHRQLKDVTLTRLTAELRAVLAHKAARDRIDPARAPL